MAGDREKCLVEGSPVMDTGTEVRYVTPRNDVTESSYLIANSARLPFTASFC